MNITKNISFGTLEVDTINGKIWLNCPNCILRIQNINFDCNNVDKFSMIDINVDKKYTSCSVYSDNIYDDNSYSLFIENVLSSIVPKTCCLEDYEKQKFLNDLFVKITEEVNKQV